MTFVKIEVKFQLERSGNRQGQSIYKRIPLVLSSCKNRYRSYIKYVYHLNRPNSSIGFYSCPCTRPVNGRHMSGPDSYDTIIFKFCIK